MDTYVQNGKQRAFLVVLFVSTKDWKQPKCTG